MVQVIRGSRDPRDVATGMLAQALGQGIGNGLNTYFANKALDGILQDKSLEDAPQSKKLESVRSALSPYGELGRQLFGDRLKIEQQAYQEKQERENARKIEQEQGVLGRFSAGEQLTSEDFASLSPKTQMALVRHLHQQQESNKKINADTLASTSFSKGYKAIIDNDLDALKDVISDPNTPLNVKTQLGSIQNQFSVRKDVKARDERNRVNSVQQAYNRAITSERGRIGKMGGLRKAEIEEINSKIKELETAKQHDMQKLLSNPESYASLSIWGSPQMRGFLPEEQGEVASEAVGVQEPQGSSDVQQRVEFLNEKFPPKEFIGKKKQDKSGRIYESDGVTWRIQE